MRRKLTLRLDADLIERAKSRAEELGKSVSQVVEDYFARFVEEPDQPDTQDAPLVRSLRGILADTDIDEGDYRRHLEEKHG